MMQEGIWHVFRMALHNSGIGVWRQLALRARCHVSIRQSPSLCNAILNTCPCLLAIWFHSSLHPFTSSECRLSYGHNTLGLEQNNRHFANIFTHIFLNGIFIGYKISYSLFKCHKTLLLRVQLQHGIKLLSACHWLGGNRLTHVVNPLFCW